MKLNECEELKRDDMEDASPLEYCMMPVELLHMLRGSFYRENQSVEDVFDAVSYSQTYIFTGRPGCGSNEILDAYAVSAVFSGYTVFRISMIQLMGEDQNATISSINELMDDIEDRYIKSDTEDLVFLFLLVEDIWLLNDDTKAARMFFSRLRKLKAGFIKSQNGQVIIAACYDGKTEEMPDIFRIDAHIIPLDTQDRLTRERYFKNCLEKLLENQDKITLGQLVDMTEGFSLGELQMVVEKLSMYIRGINLQEDPYMDLDFPESITETVNMDISMETVEKLVEQVRSSRCCDDMPRIRRSVYNYPSAKLAGGAIGLAAPMLNAVTSEISEESKKEKAKMENAQNVMNNATAAMNMTADDMNTDIVPEVEKSYNRPPLPIL